MAALGFGLLGLTLTIAAVRYTLAGWTGSPSPATAVMHSVVAAGGIVAYHWAFANAVALVNVVTDQVMTWPVVADGLGRTVKVMFGGSLLIGSGSVFLALLALVAIFFATSLFIMKVAVLMLAAMLYVAGPAIIALYPLPQTARFVHTWLLAALMVAFVPLGWCVIFATAGALSLDVTSFGSLGGQGAAAVIGAKTAGAFAGLLMFAFAAVWPLKLMKQLNGVATGISPGAGPSAARGTPQAAAPARVQAAQARLRAGILAGGTAIGAAAGALGAPKGGPLGALTRGTTARLKPTTTPPPTAGEASQRPERRTPSERLRAAADVIRQAPSAIRAAAAAAATPAAAGRTSRGRKSRPPRRRNQPYTPTTATPTKPAASSTGASADRGAAVGSPPSRSQPVPTPPAPAAPPAPPVPTHPAPDPSPASTSVPTPREAHQEPDPGDRAARIRAAESRATPEPPPTTEQ